MPCTTEMTAMRNITPIVTPSSVKKLFSFWTRICARARRIASMKGMLDADFRCAACRLDLRSEILPSVVALDHAVLQHDDAARVRGDVGLVGDHDHRLPFRGETLEDAHDFFRSRRVEVTCRLVGEEIR